MYKCEDCEKSFETPEMLQATWDDPGVYPNGTAGYPLRSFNYYIECCPYCESEEFYELVEDEEESEELD